jgi:hypothetical protein
MIHNDSKESNACRQVDARHLMYAYIIKHMAVVGTARNQER